MTAEELTRAQAQEIAKMYLEGEPPPDVTLGDIQDGSVMARYILSLPDTDAQAQRIAELEAQLAECEQRLDHTLIAHQEAVSGVPDTAKIDYQSSQNLIADCQLVARGPDARAVEIARAILDEYPKVGAEHNKPDRRKYGTNHLIELARAYISSGALATAQAVTLTEEEKNYLAAMDVSPSTNVATLQYDVLNLRRIVTRLTGASTPALGDAHG